MKTDRVAEALWHITPGRAEIRHATMGDGDVIVRMVASLVSRGTERLIFEGRVPETEFETMRAPHQEGAFPFPVKYGYSAMGVVEEGPERLVGCHVFALFPHQTVFALPEAALTPVETASPRLALAANVETALNALWDSGAGPGDRICVVGAGVVGCLAAWLAGRLPGADVTLVDKVPQRADLASQLGVNFTTDAAELRDHDIAFHASASAAGLAAAMGTLGTEGRLVEMSWYGAGDVPAPLGGSFHSRRLQLISSQVGMVSPSRRSRWSHARRLAKAAELTADPALDCLIGERVPFVEVPGRIGDILSPNNPSISTLITYD